VIRVDPEVLVPVILTLRVTMRVLHVRRLKGDVAVIVEADDHAVVETEADTDKVTEAEDCGNE
jgi:hypothetical protein